MVESYWKRAKKMTTFAKKNLETDTIREGMIIHLADDPSEIAATVDNETGNVIYSITFKSDDEAAKEDGGSTSFL